MAQSETVSELLNGFFEERQRRASLETFVTQAEAAGERQLSKIFRAVIASDTFREELMREHLPQHAKLANDYYVCPRCGLIYEPDAPELCVADEAPAAEFIHIG